MCENSQFLLSRSHTALWLHNMANIALFHLDLHSKILYTLIENSLTVLIEYMSIFCEMHLRVV